MVVPKLTLGRQNGLMKLSKYVIPFPLNCRPVVGTVAGQKCRFMAAAVVCGVYACRIWSRLFTTLIAFHVDNESVVFAIVNSMRGRTTHNNNYYDD